MLLDCMGIIGSFIMYISSSSSTQTLQISLHTPMRL